MPDSLVVLLRMSYLALSSVFTVVRLLLVSGAEKDVEILALRHQLVVFAAADRPAAGKQSRQRREQHRVPGFQARPIDLAAKDRD